MSRLCIRKGCGTDLVRKDGLPDFRRIFCSAKCRLADGLEKLRARRAAAAGRKCPRCGRRSTGDARFRRGVSRNTPRKTGSAKKQVGE